MQNYLHYYIGSKVSIDGGQEEGILTGVQLFPGSTQILYRCLITSEKFNGFTEEYFDTADNPNPRIKPLLRPIDSMTEEEGLEIAKSVYLQIYGSDNSLRMDRKYVQDEQVGFVLYDSDGDRNGLTIDTERGIEFSVDSQQMNVRQFDLLDYLLPEFDIFLMVENGLAIYKTKTL